MRRAIPLVLVVTLLALLPAMASSNSASKEERNSIVITYKDGHQLTIPLSDIAHIEFKSAPATSPAAATPPPPPAVVPGGGVAFVGKWKVGEGMGIGPFDSVFYITLHPDGKADRTLGSAHGTWTVVDGEARITWEDGWRDAIRRNGKLFEKAAFEPGHTFTDKPSNIAKAERAETEPI